MNLARNRLTERYFGGAKPAADQLMNRFFCDQLALPDDGHSLTDALDLRKVVRRHEDRASGIAPLPHELLEIPLDERVKSVRRFIQNEQIGIGLEGGDECELLPHTLGVGT